MKITWASNAPWAATGYGTQTRQVLKRLIADGHDVAVANNFGLRGAPLRDPETGVLVLPEGADVYGNDVLQNHHRVHSGNEPGWVITLYDVWVYQDWPGSRIASWTPVDHYPVPPKVADWARTHETIAMSRFGETALKEVGVRPHYAPHAIELDTWKPTPLLPDGRTVRQALNVPDDAFLVMVNAANKGNVPPRKSWGEVLSALTLFMRDRPDAYAYIHTELQAVYGGVDLVVLQMALGMDAERLRFPDQYANRMGFIPQTVLAAHYTAADVLLATSMGEGFGIPVIEAQACGTPVIVTNFSAQPELVGAGWQVGFQPWWDFTQASWLALPQVTQIVVALHQAYDLRQDTERLARFKSDAIAKAAEYDADKVYAEHWRPILATLEEKLKPVPRAVRRKNARKKAA